MANVCKAMDQAMKSMNLEKISSLMDKFENQFEDLDVQSSVMENAMSQTTTTTVPQNEVDNLMQQVADEAGLVPRSLGMSAAFTPRELFEIFSPFQFGFEHGPTHWSSRKHWPVNSNFSRARRTYSTFGQIATIMCF